MNWPEIATAYHQAAPYIVPAILVLPSIVPPILKAAQAAWNGTAAGTSWVVRGAAAAGAGFTSWQKQPMAVAAETAIGLTPETIANLNKLAARMPDLEAMLTGAATVTVQQPGPDTTVAVAVAPAIPVVSPAPVV